ncbi:Hpr(Ser) kinase/phosphatase [Mycoplasmopsis mustelae]|uniref:Hpr(Ser) kinase/phosphatase n=1 Tax=Mycoplasmopsis mustelae TaxID=171289 RepID=A0A4R7UE38_9BACT|nr:HPr(Ser) kinase/phosphatase [Mycoplasmopsis mustelae]TDV24093.1 Hpr(Ser) kinase/phosphatase [Mycoplasmopsis mustelae]
MNRIKINAAKIVDSFSLKLINQTPETINWNFIYRPAIKRVGLELAERIENLNSNGNLICWGTSESIWFQSIGKKESLKAIEHIFKTQPPLVVLSRGVMKPALSWIESIANKYHVPVCITNLSSSSITTIIGSYLNNYFCEEVQVHGCLVLVGGTGVLIIGQSGVGKSEAALELVQKGHILISDDSVLIKNNGNLFIGRSPKITRNMLEVRGIGIIDIKYTYGIKAVASSTIIHLVVELVRSDVQNELDRLGIGFLSYPILGRSIKKIQIPIKEGGSVSSLIEAAVSAYLSKHDGLDILREMEKRRLDTDE